LTKYYYRTIILFELDAPSSPLECGGKPPLFLLPGPATFFSESLCPDSTSVAPSRSYREDPGPAGTRPGRTPRKIRPCHSLRP